MPAGMDYDRLVVLGRIEQAMADELQRRYSHDCRGSPGRKAAAAQQASADRLRKEIKRRKKGKGNG